LAKLGKIVVHVDDLAFRGPTCGFVVATSVERYPATSKRIGGADLLPGQTKSEGKFT
jgi:hypothetical protein